jgi:hypothetical protein
MDLTNNQPTRKISKVNNDSAVSSSKTAKGSLSQTDEELNDPFPDYPLYPPSEDIYSNYTKEDEVDIEQPYNLKTIVDRYGVPIRKDAEEELTGDNLDVPGAELDDYQEFIGSEDEENNYYSLGGDNHDNLDEYSGNGDDL